MHRNFSGSWREIFRLLFVFFISQDVLAQVIITTYAGGYNGDGYPAGDALLLHPSRSGVALSPEEALYFVDSTNYRIMKVNADSTVQQVAGNGTRGYSGDGGAAILAQLNGPAGIAFSSNGEMYITDRNNHCIRKVSVDGIIHTIAGTAGLYGFYGDGKQSTGALLNFPTLICTDGLDNIFFYDSQNLCIRKINPSGIISTIKTQPDNFTNISSIKADSAGNLFYSISNGQFYKITPDGIESAVSPVSYSSCAQSKSGTKYCVIENGIQRISEGGIRKTIVGAPYNYLLTFGEGRSSDQAQLELITGLTIDTEDNLYIIERASLPAYESGATGSIRRVNFQTRKINKFTGILGRRLPVSKHRLDNLNYGNFSKAVLDTVNHRFYFSNALSTGSFIEWVGKDDTVHSFLRIGPDYGFAQTMTSDRYGNLYYVVNRGANTFPSTVVKVVPPSTSSNFFSDNFNIPDMVMDPDNNLYYISDHRIMKRSVSGSITTIAGNGTESFSGDSGIAVNATLNNPHQLTIDHTGQIYVAETGRIRRIDNNGIITTVAGNGFTGFSGDGGPAALAQIGNVTDLVCDKSGNLYIAENYDPGNTALYYKSRVRIMTGLSSSVNGTIPASAVIFKTYPNPTSEYLNIEGSSLKNIQLCSPTGTILMNIRVGNSIQRNVMNLSTLPPGIYYLMLTNKDGARQIEKIIVDGL